MRQFAKISPKFWLGETARAIRCHPEAQIVAYYLLTSPHSNMLGMYCLPLAYISGDTGLPFEGVTKGVTKLVEVGFCDYDKNVDLVLVFKMALFQTGDVLGEKDNNRTMVAKLYAELPESRLLSTFYGIYGSAYGLPLHRGLGTPLPTPFGETRDMRHETRDTETGNTIPPLALVSGKPKPSDAVNDVFTYWATTTNHPKARLDPKRTKSIQQALKLGYTVADLKQAIDGNKRSPYHSGKNQTNTVYDSLELILRDASKIDGFIAFSEGTGTNLGQSVDDFMADSKAITERLFKNNEKVVNNG